MMMMMMMMMHIKMSPSSPFFSVTPKISPSFKFVHISCSSASLDQTPSPNSDFIKDYLISSCGLSPQKANNASRFITSIDSPTNPDSVRHFLKHHGFSDIDISFIISAYPRILIANVEQTIGPNFQTLSQMGFTQHQLHKLIVNNPQALLLHTAIARIEFWRNLFNGDMKKLVQAFTRNRGLVNLDIDKNVIPKIALLKDHGLSESQIEMTVLQSTGLFKKKIIVMEELLKRVQELGFPCESSMFVHGLLAICSIRHVTFKSKIALFKSFGWTEDEFFTALGKSPGFVTLSESNLRSKMELLMNRAGCSPSYIACRPSLLNYSLDKRLLPRLQVLEIVKSTESVKKKPDLYAIMCCSEKMFMDNFIIRYKVLVPNLEETYLAAHRGL